MSIKNPSQPRRRGAPTGNHNAVKHGFYATKFKKSERTALDTSEFSGLSEEIALLRLYIRRVVAQSLQSDDFYQNLETLRVLSLACSSLSRLVRTHALVAMSGDDEFRQAFDDVMKEITKDLVNKDFSTWPSYDQARVPVSTAAPPDPVDQNTG